MRSLENFFKKFFYRAEESVYAVEKPGKALFAEPQEASGSGKENGTDSQRNPFRLKIYRLSFP